MAAKRFPSFKTHAAASCFNCEGDLDGSYWSESGYAPRNGQYLQHCCKCDLRTFYDLKQTVAAS